MIEPRTAGRVKFAKTAYVKQMEYKARSFNHAVSQITGFRLFDKQSAKRADDLSDCAMYAVLLRVGDGRARRQDKSSGSPHGSAVAHSQFFLGRGDLVLPRQNYGLTDRLSATRPHIYYLKCQ